MCTFSVKNFTKRRLQKKVTTRRGLRKNLLKTSMPQKNTVLMSQFKLALVYRLYSQFISAFFTLFWPTITIEALTTIRLSIPESNG